MFIYAYPLWVVAATLPLAAMFDEIVGVTSARHN
jgi:hypothetical protein